MIRRKIFFILLCMFGVLTVSAQDTAPKGAFLRVGNFAADSVDIYLDDALVLETLSFGETVRYMPLAAGAHTLRVTPIDSAEDAIEPMPLDVIEGHSYTIALTEQNALVIDETAALSAAGLQTNSTVLFLNTSSIPLDVYFGGELVADELASDGYFVRDAPAESLLIGILSADQPVIGVDFRGVPNNYALLAFVGLPNEGGYTIAQANYSSLNAADFLAGWGIGESDGVNLALAAFDNASLHDELAAATPLTVFVPVNAAFDAVPEETLDVWLEFRAQLEAVMGYHVISGETLLSDLNEELFGSGTTTLTTLQGTALNITFDENGALLDNTARVIGAPFRVNNGILYIIDTVLQTPLAEMTPEPDTTEG